MSFVVTPPETLASAAGTLQGIGLAVATENRAPLAPTTKVVVSMLAASACSYAVTEAANVMSAG